MRLLHKLGLSHQQTIDLISNLEDLTELLTAALTETKADPLKINDDQRFNHIATLQTTAAQLRHAASNYLTNI